MANNKKVSAKKFKSAAAASYIFAVILLVVGVYNIFMCTVYESLYIIWLPAIFVVGGIAMLCLASNFRIKAKSAPTEDEVKQFERELMAEPEKQMDGAVFSVKGVRGRNLYVFDDKCVINTTAGIGSFLTGNATDGEKTIYYTDVIGVQYKPSGINIGFLQLETASSQMNNRSSNYFNENSFTFDTTTVSNERMAEVAEYVKKRVDEFKRSSGKPVIQQTASSADELKKFKELLDSGVITQEEFDAKKKQLLGL